MNEKLEDLIDQYTELFHTARLNCAESALMILCDYYGLGGDFAPRIATAFGGGIAGTQGFCGALSGGMMGIGLLLGREIGGDKVPSNEMGKKLIAWATEQKSSCLCREISGVDLSDPGQSAAFRAENGGHVTICEPLVGEVCRWLVEQIG